MNVPAHNSAAWDDLADQGIRWSVPVSREVIAGARAGVWEVILTPTKAVPRDWFGALEGKSVLCLASGGGQQAPILAAAGAQVTSFDNSVKQLERDDLVAKRDDLRLRLEQGDAADLGRFADESFDLIFHPCSNCYMAELLLVWRECFRVLRRGGALLSGFNNPAVYIFDQESEDQGVLRVEHPLPYADLEFLSETELATRIERHEPLEWSHTLEMQIGGQLEAGFLLAGFYEDYWDDEARLLNRFLPSFIATRAIKL